ncbi:MAG: SDR family NAD(P)-dependent oxidoreductase, partial [Burkholderiales bacterium]
MPALSGRGIVVTGAASGIGEGLARALAARGAKLLLADRDAARLDAVAESLRAAGADCDAMACDVADPGTAPALAARALERWGGADVVITNAGV